MKTAPLLTASVYAHETNTLLQVTQMRGSLRNEGIGDERPSGEFLDLEESGCIDMYGDKLEFLAEDCTLKDFFIFKGSVAESEAGFVAPTFHPNFYGDDDKWTSEPVQKGEWVSDCVAYVRMHQAHHLPSKDCASWCESHNMTCVKGSDDAHHQTNGLANWMGGKGYERTACTLLPSGNSRQDESDHGCHQSFNTQVCACDRPKTTTTTSTRVTSEGESCCVDGDGVPFVGMSEECTFKDFFVFDGTPADNRGPFIKPTYPADTYGSDDRWATIPVQEGDWKASCVAYVKTDGGNCKDWCESNGMMCQKAMDDAHFQTVGLDSFLAEGGYAPTDCTLHPQSSDRQTSDEDGCLQEWQTQICACVKGRMPPDHTYNQGCLDNHGDLFAEVIEDCTNKDFFEWRKGILEDGAPPTYDVTSYGADENWVTKKVQQDGWEGSCVAYVQTNGQNCKEWCEAKGMTCTKGMDDAHHQTKGLSEYLEGGGYAPTDCTLLPSSSARQIGDDNGCLQRWKTQICGCKE